ncbi:FRIGIDA-like protein 4a isoform X1 [Rhododendron vialii]|uniref:FRIGIDA-like protein 4a isoform X1 n=1 Tax=Rhododendron vialii TaxID=182163 RepID=UPI00265E4AE9|nr:FRIGIDA-like protein 4a isoform X1 [Rhododendron vialii]
MGSIPDPGDEFAESTHPPPQPSFDEFQRTASLMTSCTLLWKELSDHFSSLEQDLKNKSDALNHKLQTLDAQTKQSLQVLEHREDTINAAVSVALQKVKEQKEAALNDAVVFGEVDNDEGLLLKLRRFCLKMDSEGFWRFVAERKKELDSIRAQMSAALADCVDPARFVLEAISEVFPVDKRGDKSNDLGWACVLILESLIPAVVDPIMGGSRLLVTPRMRARAREIAETWKRSLDERGGIENVKTPDVHTFLQHLVSFGIVKKEDVELYRKLVVASAWRKQMPKLALSLGLGDKMPDMIEELISRGQQVDAVHFTYEVGLEDKFPPVPLLKAFLKDAKKAANSILEDPNNSGRAAQLASRKEQSALRAVIKCIEEYKLEAEFPPESLKKRLEQLEKTKVEKKRPAAAPANKRTRANNGGPMPPAKAGRSTNAYVSSFPAAPTYVRSPSHTQYPMGVPSYPSSPVMYGSRSPPTHPYAYSPESAPPTFAVSYPVAQVNYSPYGGYGNGVAPAYQHAYY